MGSTTMEQQTQAIRSAIKALEVERRAIRKREIAGEDVSDVIEMIDAERQALEDAISVIKKAATFRAALKDFIND
jgi:hypothetical protein